jgi:hypothetical protein
LAAVRAPVGAMVNEEHSLNIRPDTKFLVFSQQAKKKHRHNFSRNRRSPPKPNASGAPAWSGYSYVIAVRAWLSIIFRPPPVKGLEIASIKPFPA